MSSPDLDSLLQFSIQAAEKACLEILKVYRSDNFETERKDDHSPLTRADRLAHQAIVHILQDTNLPILSEEGKNIPYEERKHWEFFWMVDPLDGTKEFLKRNDEFTVNIALIHHHEPILGVVAVPVNGDVYYAIRGKGAYLKRNAKVVRLMNTKKSDWKQKGLRIVASRSHMNEETTRFIQSFDSPVLTSKGSSLKFMLLAEDQADIYPRFAPTMEWDTAAAHAILNEVGFRVIQQGTNKPLLYNKPELLNPGFLCQ
jgi:3'(2'), 5'-bisphosphate nucleotidase